MKIAVLTNHNSYFGKKLVLALEQNQIAIESVVIIHQPLSYHIKLFKFIKKRVGFFQAVIFAVIQVLKDFFSTKEKIHYNQLLSKKVSTKETNSAQTENILKEISPDIIVLAQTGIIKKNIIEIAQTGVLNAHPAILPFYRGIDCLKWAIFNDDISKIGTSVHWVDSGVDTGFIIRTEQVKIDPHLSLDQLEWVLYENCISNLVFVLKQMENGEICKGTEQKKTTGKQYYKMSVLNEIKVRRKLKAMRGHETN